VALNKIILSALFFILLIPIAYAAPPFISSGNPTIGYDIAAPIYDSIKANQTFTFNWHVFNISSGAPIYKNMSCTFHLYDPVGKHQYEKTAITTYDHIYDLEAEVAGGNFTALGYYDTIIQCNSTGGLGGWYKAEFEVTTTGYPNTPGVMASAGLGAFGYMALFFVLAMVLLWLSTSFENQFNMADEVGVQRLKQYKILIQPFFFFASLYLILMGVTSVSVGFGQFTIAPGVNNLINSLLFMIGWAIQFAFYIYILFVVYVLINYMRQAHLKKTQMRYR